MDIKSSKKKRKLASLHDKFFEVANEFPSNIAISYCTENGTEISISYKELEVLSLEVSKNIWKSNAKLYNDGDSAIFAIFCDAGISAIACMLAILKNGAFIYLSPELTELEFVNLMKKISINFIVVQNKYLTKIPKLFDSIICKNIVVLADEFTLININSKNFKDVMKISYSSEYPLAYVICTSGSTGFPKIVYVPHDCIVPNIKDFQAIFHITCTDTILSTSPFYFDPSIVDIFLGISFGARVVIVAPDILRKTKLLACIIENYPISFMQITPALFRSVCANLNLFQGIIKHKTLRAIALGGEMFPSKTDWSSWFDTQCKIKIYNLYGLTELSCWASCHEVDMIKYLSSTPSKNSTLLVPIGKPLTGVNIFLTDIQGNKIISGEGSIVLTGERNVCHLADHNIPYQCNGQPLNTGDIGYTDGINVFCVGRSDDIVKRNACKISLTEIEITSKYLEGVGESCAVYCENKIFLFVTTISKCTLNEKLLKARLKKYLSSWKLPDKIMVVKIFPLNKNYKVDKQSLLAMLTCNTKTLHPPLKSRAEVESVKSIIQSLWKDFVGCNPKENDNFINLGGNSLQAVQLAEKIQSLVVYDNPLILQTILNNNFEDICYLINNDSPMQSSNLSDGGDNILKTFMHNLKNRVFRKYYACQGGHFIYKKTSLFITNRQMNIMWTVLLDKCIDSSPLVVDYNGQIKIFMGSHSHNFYCIDGEGKIKWKVILPDRIEGSACLSRDEEAVYIGCYNGLLYCFDVNDGKELWKIETQGKIKSTCIVNRESGNIIFGSYDKHLYCSDKSGCLKWKTKLSNGFISSNSVIANDCVFTGTLDGYIICLNIYNGIGKWKKFIGKPIFSSLAICHLGIIFGCTDNFVYCVSFDSEVIWKYKTGAPIFSSPLVLECEFLSILIIGSHDNNLYFLNTNGNKIAIYQGTSAFYSTPFIVLKDSKTLIVYATETDGIIHSIELEKCEETWNQKSVHSIHLNGQIFSSPVFYKEKIYVGCRDNMLYCLNT